MLQLEAGRQHLYNLGTILRLEKVKFRSEILKRSLKLNVSNAAVRSVDKKGTFDIFLKTAKSQNLSPRLKKIKKTLLAKSA